MDIRNFFGGGGGGAKKALSSSKKSEKPKPKPAAKKKQEESAEKVTKTKTEEKKVEKKPIKKKVIDLSDSEDDVDMVETSAISAKQKDPPKAPTSSGDTKAPKRKEPEATVKKAATPEKKEEEPESESDKEEEKPSPVKKRRTTTTTPKKKKEPAPVPPKPTEAIESYPDPSSGIFDGYTFVFTGVLSNLSRDDAIDYVKSYGGRVTTAVSGKTSYLVIGDELEDGRPVEEGSKFKKATELGKVVILKNEGDLYGLAKLLDEKKKALNPKVESNTAPAVANPYAKKSAVANPYSKPSGPVSNPYAKSGAVSNPYAKSGGGVSNPYAKSAAPSNPYASKSSSANPYAAKGQSSQNSCQGGGRADMSDSSALVSAFIGNTTKLQLLYLILSCQFSGQTNMHLVVPI